MKRGCSIGIRGGGLAGLTLARRIVERAPAARVTVFDIRPCLPHPHRTFCFFGGSAGDHGAPVAAKWRSVRFVGSDFDRRVGCADTPYTLVRGADFFAQTVQFLSTQNVEFRWSCPSVELHKGGITAGGRDFTFDVVVDAAYERSTVEAALWQSFAGRVVETDGDAFNPDEALLMDLLPSSVESSVGFVYVLPFSATQALVEHTTFSAAPRPEGEHLEECQRWLDRRGIVVRREISRELGAIPMGVGRGEAAPWPVIGTNGGGVRAGTGYGFAGINRQAERLADVIAGGAHRPGQWRSSPTPLALRIGDALFLRALRRAPLHGRVLIEGLLRRASDRDIVAFLAGSAHTAQSLRVMGGVPRTTMVRALCS